ncbi:MAG: radical SAM protein [Bradymonadales bacterium]|nr:radical SAM protein [Bradymonadales bacterium]
MRPLYFDLIDRCQLSCPSCYHGLYGGTGQVMSLDRCTAILDHCIGTLGVDLVGAFNWGEPLLYPQLSGFLELTTRYPQVTFCLSSNMNGDLSVDLARSIVSSVDVLLLSVSGLDPDVYRLYHRGGDLERVLANIDRLIQARDDVVSPISLDWVLGLHLFNTAQVEPVEAYCRQRRIRFSPTRYYVTNVEDVHRILLGQDVPEQAWQVLYASLRQAREDIEHRLTPGRCHMLADIVVDCDGRLMTCCGGKILLDRLVTEVQSVAELISVKQANRFCAECLRSGLAGYFAVAS